MLGEPLVEKTYNMLVNFRGLRVRLRVFLSSLRSWWHLCHCLSKVMSADSNPALILWRPALCRRPTGARTRSWGIAFALVAAGLVFAGLVPAKAAEIQWQHLTSSQGE